ncbi:MAG: hypothetical protein ACRENP_09345 [Longimicrobiales bacterium]
MLTRCIFCHQAFPANQRLEHLPMGQRIAFDPQRGRLWCVCSVCQGWTLLPIEQRWEALEELERLASDRARLLLQGENIALLRVDTLELIRIGRAGLREEAWWRYGDELARRSQHARRLKKRGKIMGALFWTVMFGVPIWSDDNAAWWLERARDKSFGKHAWRGQARCSQCGRARTSLKFSELRDVHVLGDLNVLALSLPCTCRAGAAVQLGGAAATHTLRRLLAYNNYAGGNASDVQRAAAHVERSGSSVLLLDGVLPMRRSLAVLEPVASLTLEIALNHDVERELLQLEVAELEARWREEEAIAAIVDRELT